MAKTPSKEQRVKEGLFKSGIFSRERADRAVRDEESASDWSTVRRMIDPLAQHVNTIQSARAKGGRDRAKKYADRDAWLQAKAAEIRAKPPLGRATWFASDVAKSVQGKLAERRHQLREAHTRGALDKDELHFELEALKITSEHIARILRRK